MANRWGNSGNSERLYFLAVLENTLESPWTARRSNQSILKEINPEYLLEGLMLKLQYFGHLLRRASPDAVKDWRQEEKGMTEDEMVGWHHWLNGHEFEQALGDGGGQGILACCSPWGCKKLEMTDRLNDNNGEPCHTDASPFLFPVDPQGQLREPGNSPVLH